MELITQSALSCICARKDTVLFRPFSLFLTCAPHGSDVSMRHGHAVAEDLGPSRASSTAVP